MGHTQTKIHRIDQNIYAIYQTNKIIIDSVHDGSKIHYNIKQKPNCNTQIIHNSELKSI